MQAPLLFVLLLGVSSAAGAQTPPPLWSIGESDGDTREFALAPAGYGGFREPGLFLVGASDPARDWPYVLPGPDDFWAPHGPHTFEVYFGLLEAPEAEFRLVLDFVDTHGSSPPLVEVRVNDQSWEFQTPVGGGDASVFGDPAQGREHEIAVAVPADSLVAGTNRVEITARAGSWAAPEKTGSRRAHACDADPARARSHGSRCPARPRSRPRPESCSTCGSRR